MSQLEIDTESGGKKDYFKVTLTYRSDINYQVYGTCLFLREPLYLMSWSYILILLTK